jgi:hypothetical protein
LLFSKHGLNAEREHELKVTNLGPKHKGEGTDLLVDFVKSTAQIVAPQGTTLANTTLEETDVRLVYTGNWTVCTCRFLLSNSLPLHSILPFNPSFSSEQTD